MSYQSQKQQVLQLFQHAIALAQQQKSGQIEQNLHQAAKHLAEGKMYVVVAGEFKQGKSSLLNALLNEPGLFPVDVDITTNLISTIGYGPTEKITVLLGEPSYEKVIQRAEIPNYVTEQRNQKNKQQARMLLIESPNEQLKEGLVLVDTPGVGGLNEDHTALSYAFIPNADAVLFVSDALAPLSTKELEFVDLVAGHCQEMIFVVTKIDIAGGYRTIVENNREKLAHQLKRPGDQIPIIPVSSRAKLSYLKSQDTEDLEDSNFVALESQLWQFLGQRQGYLLLMRAVGELGRGLAELKMPLQAELETLSRRTQAEVQEMEERLQQAKDHYQTLLDNSANWRVKLSDGLNDIRSRLGEQFRIGFVNIHREIEKNMENNRLLQTPLHIATLLEQDIDALIINLGSEFKQQVAELHLALETITGLDLNPFEDELGLKEKFELVLNNNQVNKTGWWEKSLNAAKMSGYNSTAGATVLSLIGGTVGAIAGFFVGGVGAIPGAQIGATLGGMLGGVAGALTGLKDGLTQVSERDKALLKRELWKKITPYLQDIQRNCERELNNTIRDLERSIRDDLTNKLKREKENRERTLKAVQEARKLTDEQAARRIQELQGSLQPLNQLLAKVDQLAEAISKQEVPLKAVPEPAGLPQLQPASPTASKDGDRGNWADEE